MEKTSAVSITIHDLSGAPLSPKVIADVEKYAEKVAKKEGLVVNVARG